MKKHVPNALTITRMVLALAFPFIPVSWRLPVFVLSAITEFSDGYLGRKWNATSYWGKILDPIADKMFVFAMIATFFFEGSVQFWELTLVGVRDIVVFAGAAGIYLFGDRSEFERSRPRWIGKLTTNLQFAFLFTALMWSSVPLWLVLLTGAFSIAAAVDYTVFYFREMRAGAAEGPGSS